MSEKSNHPKTVQEKMNHLAELVAWFQGADFSLEEAVEKYKHAEALAKEIEDDLTGLKNEISVIRRKFEDEAA